MNDESEHIDLGVNPKEQYGDIGGMGLMIQPESGPSDSQKSYPSFRYSGPEELDLPDEGTMEVKFKKVSETSSTRPSGKRWYECCIEVQCICEVESDEPNSPTSRDTSAEDALDTLAKELSARRARE